MQSPLIVHDTDELESAMVQLIHLIQESVEGEDYDVADTASDITEKLLTAFPDDYPFRERIEEVTDYFDGSAAELSDQQKTTLAKLLRDYENYLYPPTQ